MKKKTENLKPFPGSQRQRQRAKRLLSCVHISEGFWKVWGGEIEHIVKVSGSSYFCDCKIMAEKQRPICSHIVKVMMETGDFPPPRKTKHDQ